MNAEPIIERIKKLLRLGQSANQHEAELAVQRAFELANRFDLEPRAESGEGPVRSGVFTDCRAACPYYVRTDTGGGGQHDCAHPENAPQLPTNQTPCDPRVCPVFSSDDPDGDEENCLYEHEVEGQYVLPVGGAEQAGGVGDRAPRPRKEGMNAEMKGGRTASSYTPPFPSPGSAPLRWADFKWPRWIPQSVRKELRGFWSEDFHRSPREWQKSFEYAHANHPKLGAKVKCDGNGWGCRRKRTGRWVPMWNNIGRLICRDGTILVRSTGSIIREQNVLSNPASPA